MSIENSNDESLNTAVDAFFFAMMFFLFILSWVTVAVVGRAIDNLTFQTFKLKQDSTYHTVVIALVIVAIEFATIYYFSSIGIAIYDTSNWGINSQNMLSKSNFVASGDTKISTINEIASLASITII